LGGLASGVAGGMLAEGARQFAQGKRPMVGLLTPANARRVAEQLAQLRGAGRYSRPVPATCIPIGSRFVDQRFSVLGRQFQEVIECLIGT